MRRGTSVLLLLLLVLAPACSDDPTAPSPGSLETEFGNLPRLLSKRVEEGGPNPAPLTLNLSNTGTCDLDFNVSWVTADGRAWLSVSPVSGVLPAMATGVLSKATSTPLTVTLDVIGPALYPGTYTGSITITGNCSSSGEPALGSPAVIAVNLTVTALTATIVVDDDRLDQDVPTLVDEWAPMPTGPSARGGHSAVWTGREMMVWGGATSQTAPTSVDTSVFYYNTQYGGWIEAFGSGAPVARRDHSAVWTGTEMIVFGGVSTLGGPALDSGGVYDPLSSTWSPTAFLDAPSLTGHVAVWTGIRMVVYQGSPSPQGGVYDPDTQTWTQMAYLADAPSGAMLCAVWTGWEMLVWGESGGAAYDPLGDYWTPLPSSSYIQGRRGYAAVWTGREMIVWGGVEAGVSVDTGASYDPARRRWSSMTATGAPTARNGHRAVWTGGVMIVWGGVDDAGIHAGDGGIYDPATNTWTTMTTVAAPLSTTGPGLVWTGAEMLSWGGYGIGGAGVDTGGEYR